MDLDALRLATHLGGHLLSGPTPAHTLILVERLQAHGLPSLLVLGRTPEDLQNVVQAWERGAPALNLMAVLPARDTQLAPALAFHRLRLGSLVGAVEAGLPWLGGKPMMVKRLPGRLRTANPMPLEPAALRPLEQADLRSQLEVSEGGLVEPFLRPPWEPAEGTFTALWWPGVPLPPGVEVVLPPLVLPSHTPFSEAMRTALRVGSDRPVPWLPYPGDPSGLHALAQLTSELAAFLGPEETWREALTRVAALPAPPHFCTRC